MSVLPARALPNALLRPPRPRRNNRLMYRGERFNGYSHAAGAVLAVGAAGTLIAQAASKGDAWKMVSFSIYGATLVLLYLTSTLYHSTRGRTKEFFRKLDYICIYLLIAGSYTPFALVTLDH